MVNRYSCFNRKKENRLKVIRDRKKARINNKKKFLGYEENERLRGNKITKKEERKLKRTEHILKAAGIDDISKIYSKKVRRKKNKNKKEKNEDMEVDDE